jgi:hypothetical protein
VSFCKANTVTTQVNDIKTLTREAFGTAAALGITGCFELLYLSILQGELP